MIKKILLFAFLLLCIADSHCLANVQKIALPITIDYPLLRNLIASRAFPEAGEKATLVNNGGGCVSLTVANPQIREHNGLINLEVVVKARIGTPMGDQCFAPVEWQGYLILNQRPVLTPDTWQLSFTTVSSGILRADRQPAKIATILWNMIESHVTSYLAGVSIDLMPPVTEIKNFLLPLFPTDKRQQTKQMLASMRPSQINVQPNSLNIAISADVDSTFSPNRNIESQQLNQEELQKAVAVWEKWDGLLVYLVTTLARQTLNEAEKRSLSNVLLDTRYRFVNEMADKTIQHDIVREQFINTWQVMAPIFRRHLLQGDHLSQALGYLAFVSSADALLVLDKLGPTLGLEISTRGLVRLMHMLNASPEMLEYHKGINPDLQKLFEIEEGNNDTPQLPSPTDTRSNSSLFQMLLSPFHTRTAYAAKSQSQFSKILQWRVPKSDVTDYVSKVGGLLNKSSLAVMKKGEVPKNRQKMFRLLIPAMAWQESCFRQFVEKDQKLTYLISYNQSSIGVMQVNERVWRGLYNLNRLRWDIQYNAATGSEIAALYLNKYALRDSERAKSMSDDKLARLIYAMYNGGPSQNTKFFKRLKKNKLYDSDKLFWEKFLLVKSGKVSQVSVCLVGK